MPSRIGIIGILLFWLGTSAYVGHREIWPRLFSDGPPPLRIDLADEAAQAAPTMWFVYRGDQQVGELTTRMEYVPADDTFRFLNAYRNLKFEFVTVSIEVPKLDTVVRVTRTGVLREQTMIGTLNAKIKTKVATIPVGEATAEISGVVVNGQLVGNCLLKSPIGNLEKTLDPIEVSEGQILNPMMPVSRLQDVKPGRRWVIREVDPLREALNLLFKDLLKSSEVIASTLPQQDRRELVAEVLTSTEKLDRKNGEPIECWIIEYRGDEVLARTWVAISDGRVLRQEAAGFGERLRFERQE